MRLAANPSRLRSRRMNVFAAAYPMPNAPSRNRFALKVFLCHASGDKPAVRKLYQRLQRDGFQPWLDEKDILPGQDWESEIQNALRTADVVLVCLSSHAVNKYGYVQKEIRLALDAADQKRESRRARITIR